MVTDLSAGTNVRVRRLLQTVEARIHGSSESVLVATGWWAASNVDTQITSPLLYDVYQMVEEDGDIRMLCRQAVKVHAFGVVGNNCLAFIEEIEVIE